MLARKEMSPKSAKDLSKSDQVSKNELTTKLYRMYDTSYLII